MASFLRLFSFLVCLSSLEFICYAADITTLDPKSFIPISGTDKKMEIIHAVPVMGRYLASVKVVARDRSEKESWIAHFKGSSMFAPAWFTKEWKLVSLGEPTYGFDQDFSPVPSDRDANSNLATLRFPQVIARDAMADECPYLYGTTTYLSCLNQDLQIEKNKKGSARRWQLKSQARGYIVVDANVWVKGPSDGRLLYRFDLESGKAADKIIEVKQLNAFLKLKATESDPFDPIEENTDRRASTSNALDSEYVQALNDTPSSFEYDVVVKEQSAYLLLRQPLVLITLNWPDGQPQKIVKVRSSDMPAWALQYGDLSLLTLEPRKEEIVAWFSVTKPFTYGELSLANPTDAQKFKANWERNRARTGNSAQLTQQTVLGVKEDYLSLGFTSTKITRIYEFKPPNNPEWLLGGYVFHIPPDGIWMSAYNTKTGQHGVTQVL